MNKSLQKSNNNRKEVISIISYFFKTESRQFNVEMAFLFGSWARGYPKIDSDIDIAVCFKNKQLSDTKLFEIITEIALRLSEKLKKEVSVIPIDEDFRKPMLYYNAVVFGVPVYIKNVESYNRLRFEAIKQMEDFSIFGLDWQLQGAKEILEELEHA